ncbi:MAG: dihydropteroate synthase [Clostridiales bacterium]|jgi:5-methyltetrahydrofolate--homocysteine methyltransferase|nr:dihydropteroate synthase [Clostridiales bacterium]
MIVVGEKLNCSVPSAYRAFEEMDALFVRNMAMKQESCGASYIDINAGLFDDEAEKLIWASEIVRDASTARISIDSANPSSIKRALKGASLSNPLINSISLEPEKFEGVLELALEHSASVVALPIDEGGIPQTEERRIENSVEIVETLHKNGMPFERIFLDILIITASVEWDAPIHALNAARRLREIYPDIHLIAGLSNVSFGLPKRSFLNHAMLAAAMLAGLDSVIMDITKEGAVISLAAANAVTGKDPYLLGYMKACRDADLP